jgi:hypothetical protein
MQHYSPLEFPLPSRNAVVSDFDCCFVPQIHPLLRGARLPPQRHAAVDVGVARRRWVKWSRRIVSIKGTNCETEASL